MEHDSFAHVTRSICTEFSRAQATFKVRHGEPMTEILEEVRQAAPDLLITGSKALNAGGRFRSGNFPMRLRKQVDGQVSVISINEPSTSQ